MHATKVHCIQDIVVTMMTQACCHHDNSELHVPAGYNRVSQSLQVSPPVAYSPSPSESPSGLTSTSSPCPATYPSPLPAACTTLAACCTLTITADSPFLTYKHNHHACNDHLAVVARLSNRETFLVNISI